MQLSKININLKITSKNYKIVAMTKNKDFIERWLSFYYYWIFVISVKMLLAQIFAKEQIVAQFWIKVFTPNDQIPNFYIVLRFTFLKYPQ